MENSNIFVTFADKIIHELTISDSFNYNYSVNNNYSVKWHKTKTGCEVDSGGLHVVLNIGMCIISIGIAWALLKLYDEPVRAWLKKKLFD